MDSHEPTSDDHATAGTPRPSRRQVLAGGAAVGIGAALGSPRPAQARSDGPASVQVAAARGGTAGDARGLAFVNGKIYTMDGSNRVVSQVLVRDGRFVAVGNGVAAQGGDVRVINLKGRMVIPGIIDSHNHIVLVGNRPGYHQPLEDAYSIQDVLDMYAARRPDVPPGEFITTIGDVSPMHIFPEHRLPTLSELDAAVPDRPVYIHPASGAARTNSLGKAFFESAPLPATVAADGTIATGQAGQGRALHALRETFLTPESRKRGALDALTHYLRHGLTTHLDQGAFQMNHTPADGIASEDNYVIHSPFLALDAEGRMPARLRFNFLHQDSDASIPTLRQRLLNSFPFFGNDMLRTGAIGEFTGNGFGAGWQEGTRAVAQAGWRNENHTLSTTDFQSEISWWEVVNQEFPIGDLRWVLAHAPFITEPWVDRLKALGCGLVLRGSGYISAQNGPPFRMVVDNGIRVGLHSDGGDIAPINPWIHLYYAVTGKNALGQVMIPGQQITRLEALQLYTSTNKWFIHEDDLGSIEVGNHADLAVLDRDYFDVPEEEIKHIKSVLTVVAGKIVYETGVR
jgi:predicted amidohydrolase YtcJ